MAILIIILMTCLTCSAQTSRKSQWFHGPPKSSGTPQLPIPGLILWVNGDHATTNQGDGSHVITWTNQTPLLAVGAYDLTQPSTADAVLRTSGGPNSKPWVQLSGIEGFRSLTSTTNYFSPTYLFAVFQQTNNTIWNCLFDGEAPKQNQVIFSAGLGIGGNGYFWSGGSSNMIYGGWPTTNWSLLEISFNGSNSWIKYNTVNLPWTNAGDASQALARFNVGENNGALASLTLGGGIAELTYYNSNLPTANIGAIESYYMTKYALSTPSIYNPTFDPARDETNLLFWFDATNSINGLGLSGANGGSVTGWCAARSQFRDEHGTTLTGYYSNKIATGTALYYSSGGGPGATMPRIGMTNCYFQPGTHANQGLPITYVVVCKNTSSSAYSAIVGDDGNAVRLLKNNDNSFALYSSGTPLTSGTGTWPSGDNNYYYIVGIFDGANSVLRTNGVQAASGNPGNSTWNGSVIYIGAQSGGLLPMHGDILRVACWNAHPSAQSITNIENWCINDFGFPTHP